MNDVIKAGELSSRLRVRGNGLPGFDNGEFECRVFNRPLKTKLDFGVAVGLRIELPEIEVGLCAVHRETE